MSRIAKKPVPVPAGVEITLQPGQVQVRGSKGTLRQAVHPDVEVRTEGAEVHVAPRRPGARALAGTTRALIANMVHGVRDGYSRSLELVGVGYRAQMKGARLSLAVGYSHPVEIPVPEGLAVETPTQTQIVVRGPDKQRVGQLAANIRAVRPPEPYKGKGIRYGDEKVVRKEAKKK